MKLFIPLFATVFASQFAVGQIYDPITPDPVPSGIAITLEPWERVPDSEGLPARMSILRQEPSGSRFFVNDQRGILHVLSGGNFQPYLDLNAEGLLHNPIGHPQMGFSSFALHPDFQENGLFYTVSTVPHSGQADFLSKRPIIDSMGVVVEPSHDDVVIEWRASDPSADRFSGSRREVLRIEQPYRDHNVGEIAFHPTSGDGLLYIASSDGGSDGIPVMRTDPLDNGQDLSVPLGKILRIDPLGSGSQNGNYGIPSSNPFRNRSGALPEIYAYGLRNPHRINWDRANASGMYAYDIGQAFVEEINKIVAGGNYGWGDREGTWVVREEDESALYPLPSDDEQRDFIYPTVMYDHHSSPGAIAGGFLYRGSAIPELRGDFVFADFTWGGRFFHSSTGGDVSLLGIIDGAGNTTDASQFLRGGEGQRTDVRFGEDHSGELYVLNKHDGWIYKVGSSNPSEAVVPGSSLVDGGSGYYSSPWFGNYFDLGASWIAHDAHGAIAIAPNASTDTLIFWDQELDWVYASKNSYPWVYLFEENEWAYFHSEGMTRWFYLSRAEEWISVERQ